MYKLSIIIPVYNTEEELPLTLNSIINQTMNFEDIEVILINDGSDDNSGEIIEKYSQDYPNIKVIHLEKNNGSPGKPRNIGMKAATAKYIMFQDSDDTFTPYACELLYDTIINDNSDIAGGLLALKDSEGNETINIDSWTNILDNSKEKFQIKRKRVEEILNSEKLFKLKINNINENTEMIKDYGFTTKIFKKTLIEQNNIEFPESLKGGEDAVFLFNCFLNAKGITFINKIISHYTQRNGINPSLTHKKTFETMKSRMNAYNLMYDISIKNDKKELFVNHLLFRKLHYWFNEHLFTTTNLTNNDIKYLLKLGQQLFEEYVNSDSQRYEYLNQICNHVQNKDYDNAIKFIKKNTKSTKYLISIIIPVFNVENYLEKTFESIYNQTIGFEKLQIIFIDDNSSDNSKNIINNLSSMYENVISIHLDYNSGAAGRPRNIGMKYATSKYIMFLDPDDLLTNEACKILFNKITEENVDLVSGLYSFESDGQMIKPQGCVKNTFTDISNDLKTRNEQTQKILDNPNFELRINSYKDKKTILGNSGFWTKIYKKSLITNHNITFPENIIGQDAVFLLNTLLNANGIIFINDIIIQYNTQRTKINKSVTSQISKKRMFEMIESFYQLYEISNLKGESESFIKYLLINKLTYFLESQMFNSRLSNKNKREILRYAQPLFHKCLRYYNIIPTYSNLFNLISEDLSESIRNINHIITNKRNNKKISIIIYITKELGNPTKLINNLFVQSGNLEIICIYDRPNENLMKMIDKTKNKNIKIIKTENNDSWIYCGLKFATGSYIQFINKNINLNEKIYGDIFNNLDLKESDLILYPHTVSIDTLNKIILDIQTKSQFIHSKNMYDENLLNITNQIYRTTFIEEYFRESFKNNLSERIFCYNYYLNANQINSI